MFTKIQVYCEGENCCFDRIKNSIKPNILINTDQISSIGPKTDWGFCQEHEKYPFRRLVMANGREFICVLESAEQLEMLLTNL